MVTLKRLVSIQKYLNLYRAVMAIKHIIFLFPAKCIDNDAVYLASCVFIIMALNKKKKKAF